MERIHKVILGVLAALIAVMVAAVIIVALTRGGDGDSADTTPTFVPPLFDESAESGAPEITDETLGYGTLALKEGFVVHVCDIPVIDDDGTVEVYFTSDANNTVWVRLLVLTEDGRQLGSTGLLRPNEYVKSVKLSETPAAGESIMYKVLSYEPDTYYSMGSASVKVTVGG